MNYNEKRDFFLDLIANPAAIHKAHATQLEILIQEYPYSNLLHALLASACRDCNTQEFETKLQTAAAYVTNQEVLYKLINRPGQLLKPEWNVHLDYAPLVTPINSTEDELSFNEADQSVSVADEIEPVIAPSVIQISKENEGNESIISEESGDETQTSILQPSEEANKKFDSEIDDDVYEEIVAIENIWIEPVSSPKDTDLVMDESSGTLNEDDETEKLILGNIAADDYFAFNRKFGENMPAPSATEQEVHTKEDEQIDLTHEKPTQRLLGSQNRGSYQRVTKYHDDKMPYSFMWWLDKTRKEHADTYQPYINFRLDTSENIKKNPDEELQHQYIENIFHLNTIEDLEQKNSPQTVSFDMKRKEDRIIERFIHEEPQIKPPSGEKLDTENKAKKSAEDSDELVTETLARVYIDQMLYHKAVDTYKKLALKIPEKSRYFASQIELLERKIN